MKIFNKLTKPSDLIKEAIENREYDKAIDMMRVDREAWETGFKAGLTVAIGAIVTGTIVGGKISGGK